jgi:hypothetical protein
MKKASTVLLTFGWIFSVLGGLIGLGISSYIISAKEKSSDGLLVSKFDEASVNQGKTMRIICLVVIAIGIIIQISNN